MKVKLAPSKFRPSVVFLHSSPTILLDSISKQSIMMRTIWIILPLAESYKPHQDHLTLQILLNLPAMVIYLPQDQMELNLEGHLVNHLETWPLDKISGKEGPKEEINLRADPKDLHQEDLKAADSTLILMDQRDFSREAWETELSPGARGDSNRSQLLLLATLLLKPPVSFNLPLPLLRLQPTQCLWL